MKAPAFAYVKPRTLSEAFELLEQHGENAKLLAGGQSLMPALNMRLATPLVLIDINGLQGLSGIASEKDKVTIRAMTRHRTVEHSSDVFHHLPLLHMAMPYVAHAAIRNRGTFGGSIALADPAAELPACSLALDATLVIGHRGGERRVPAKDFFRSLYETAVKPTEILLAAEFPVIKAGYRSEFHELAQRHGDYALVGLAAHAKLEQGLISDLRLAFFGMGTTPIMANRAAAAFEGKRFSKAAVADAQAALEDDLAPHQGGHHNAAVQMHWARALLHRAVERLSQDR